MKRNFHLHLVVMTRLPKAGSTKTRLIPALGAEGAASFHDKLARHAIGRASAFCLATGSQLTVMIAGGTPIEAKQWLGSDQLSCREQSSGDLGKRLASAVESAFSEGAGRVLVIGTDCPSLDGRIYSQAKELLENKDVVLGPALDGGYYLIGMTRPIRSLFEDIPWGTERVLQASLLAARNASLSVGLCDELSDVDVPEDLENGQRELATGSTVSVVIPALNEAPGIGDLVLNLSKSSPLEIIVADGGSQDPTVQSAIESGAKVISSPRGRAAQMNRGASSATGEYLLFLHADTVPPPDFPSLIQNLLNQPGTSAGAFRFRLKDDLGAASLIECLVNLRCSFRQTPYGDQGIFMRRAIFEQIGGFPEWPVAEDLEIIRKLKNLGKIRLTRATATTSARRWQRQGLIRTFLRHQLVILGHRLNLPPSFLARITD